MLNKNAHGLHSALANPWASFMSVCLYTALSSDGTANQSWGFGSDCAARRNWNAPNHTLCSTGQRVGRRTAPAPRLQNRYPGASQRYPKLDLQSAAQVLDNNDENIDRDLYL